MSDADHSDHSDHPDHPDHSDRPDSSDSLDRLQRWFLSAIQRPHRTDPSPDLSVNPSAADADAVEAVEEVIAPSWSLSPQARLAIYSDMYFLRLRDVLRADFGGLYAMLGRADFDALCRDFLTHHPSRRFTLNALGAPMPGYFASAVGQARWGARAAALGDMAALEQAVHRCFHAEPTPVLDASGLASVPEDAWADARFTMSAGFEVLALGYDVHRALSRQRAAEPPSDAVWTPAPTRVAVWRKGFVVWRQAVTPAMFAALNAFAHGLTMSDALEAAADAWDGDEDALEAKIFSWFSEWITEGFFAAIIPPAVDPSADTAPA
jgi:hypothetical protein